MAALPLERARSSTIEFVTTRPTTPHSEIDGDPFLFLFIHGWGCTVQEYFPLLEALASKSPQNQYAVLKTTEGHVRTAARPDEPVTTVHGIASLVNLLRDELVDGYHQKHSIRPRAVVVGHSLGSRYALEVVRQRPADYAGLVLMDGSNVNLPPKKEISARKEAQDAADVHDVDNSAVADLSQFTTQQARWPSLETYRRMLGPATPEDFKVRAFKHVASLNEAWVVGVMKDARRWDEEEYDRVVRGLAFDSMGCNAKILVLNSTEGWGGRRIRLRHGEVNALQDYIRGIFESNDQGARCKIVSVEGACHWPHVDIPEEVADILVQFAQDVKNG